MRWAYFLFSSFHLFLVLFFFLFLFFSFLVHSIFFLSFLLSAADQLGVLGISFVSFFFYLFLFSSLRSSCLLLGLFWFWLSLFRYLSLFLSDFPSPSFLFFMTSTKIVSFGWQETIMVDGRGHMIGHWIIPHIWMLSRILLKNYEVK